MNQVINEVKWKEENNSIIVTGLEVYFHPGSYWEPPENEIDAKSITINGEEINWEDNLLVERLLEKAAELSQEEEEQWEPLPEEEEEE